MTGVAEVIILLLVALTACFSPVQTVESPDRSLTVIAGPSGLPDGCKAIVSFKSTAQHVGVEVQVEAEPGIRFTDTGELVSGWYPLVLQSEETRQLAVECQLDATVLKRSGEYRITARVRLAGESVPFEQAVTSLFVAVRADDMPHALDATHPTDMTFLMAYVSGLQNLAYVFDLGTQAMPDHGWLYVRVGSPMAVGAFQLMLSVSPGIQFSPSAESIDGAHLLDPHKLQVGFEVIAAGGARYLAIPIQLEPNCLAGVYTVEVVEVTAAGSSWGEIAPIVLEIVSDSAQAGYGYGLATGNRTAHALDATVIANLLAGQPVAEAPVPAEPTVSPPPVPQPTPLPESPPALESDASWTEGEPSGDLVWQWPYAITSYGGGLWELWVHYVKPMSNIQYAQFAVLMPIYNPHFVVHQQLDPTAVYILPVGEPTVIGAEAR